MVKVQVLNNISPLGLDKFSKDIYDVSTRDNDPDAILVRSAKMHELEIGENLKAVGRAGAGVNNIPLEKMSDKGVVVFNTPGANANAVKELVISSMLLASRNICQAWDYVNNLPLENLKATVEDGKKQYSGAMCKNLRSSLKKLVFWLRYSHNNRCLSKDMLSGANAFSLGFILP